MNGYLYTSTLCCLSLCQMMCHRANITHCSRSVTATPRGQHQQYGHLSHQCQIEGTIKTLLRPVRNDGAHARHQHQGTINWWLLCASARSIGTSGDQIMSSSHLLARPQPLQSSECPLCLQQPPPRVSHSLTSTAIVCTQCVCTRPGTPPPHPPQQHHQGGDTIVTILHHHQSSGQLSSLATWRTTNMIVCQRHHAH